MKKKLIKKDHFIWSVSGFSVLLLILLVPLPWNVDLPCEVKPEKSSMIYIQTRGFLNSLKVGSGSIVTPESVLLTGKNPFLTWNYQQTEIDCKIKTYELDRLQSSPKTLASSKVKREELESDENRLVELQRKQGLLTIKAPIGGTFQLYNQHLTPGKWLQKGEIIGEIFAPGGTRIEAFMSENELKDISEGDSVSISLTGEISTYSGTVITVSPIPARLPPSPLLNIFGGPIVCYPGSGPLYQPLSSYYRIIIAAKSKHQLPIGRTGVVSIRKFSSVGGGFLRKVLHTLQRELTP